MKNSYHNGVLNFRVELVVIQKNQNKQKYIVKKTLKNKKNKKKILKKILTHKYMLIALREKKLDF
jgi:hypothetical protein